MAGLPERARELTGGELPQRGAGKRHHAFGLGEYRELGGTNPTVLAYMRTHGDDIVLCVNNMSRFPQPVELDLRRYEGVAPVELLGIFAGLAVVLAAALSVGLMGRRS